jgi:hypothetical protein
MNDHLVEIFQQYLKIESNYAVLLTGEYGVGKTHFFKGELSDKIKSITVNHDEQKYYHPIHISLFGLKSIEEIQGQIFIELYPFLKEKGLKLAFGIGKSIIRGYTRLKGLGDINEYFADLSFPKEQWLNYNELVICIDDVDRKSEKLPTDEIMGFVNSLVENLGAKIIIIANETEFEDLTSELREKVIGVTMHFKPHVSNVFHKIIEEMYSSSNSIYFDFLKIHQEYIVSVIVANKNNFRNLIYFLEHFRLIFNSLEAKFQESENFRVQKEEKQKLVLDFSIAISIEFKLGKINTENVNEIRTFYNSQIIQISELLQPARKDVYSESEEKTEIEYDEEFRNKYFSNNKRNFIESVFGYLTGQAAFIIDDLVIELNQIFKVVDGSIAPEIKVFQDLSYNNCFNLTDKEYRKLTREMMKYVDQGKYELKEYYNVFHFTTRFGNFMNYKIDSFIKRFKKGIKKGLPSYKHITDIGFYMPIHQDAEYKEEMQEIVNYCVQLNKGLKEKKEKSNKNELVELFISDCIKFFEKVTEPETPYHYRAIWTNFDPKVVHRKIVSLSNQEIWDISHYFGSRYYQRVSYELRAEKSFIEELIALIDKPKNRENNNLKNAALDILVLRLKKSLTNFIE